MPRFAIGVTLTPEERVRMNLPLQGSTSLPLSRLSSHEIVVCLPDGASCPVSYQRFGACSHRFVFGEPLGATLWLSECMNNFAPTIEQKAQELAANAFAQAMVQEQRQMRRKTVPRQSIVPPAEPQLRAKTAETFAGHYAVCMRFSCGRLSPIGKTSAKADLVIAELQDDSFSHVQFFGQQRLVIGICCRYLRRWIEPQFLPFARTTLSSTEPADTDD